MLNNIEQLASKELDFLLEDHKSFLLLMGDIASVSISETGWSHVKSYLSPASKYIVSDPIMMPQAFFDCATVSLRECFLYRGRKLIKIYVNYKFPDYENAAIQEFLIRGASLNLKQIIGMPEVSHEMVKNPDDPNKVCGIISVEAVKDSSDAADTIYMKVYNTIKTFLLIKNK